MYGTCSISTRAIDFSSWDARDILSYRIGDVAFRPQLATEATFTDNLLDLGGTPPTESFNFDDTGNRTSTGSSVSHNRLLSDGTFNYQYDSEGNRTRKTTIATG